MSHQQLPAGILPMVPEVAQAVGVCQGPPVNRPLPNPGKATIITAIIANELLYAGASLTAETILKNKNNLNQLPHGPLTRPSEQLGYLASVQALQVNNSFKPSRATDIHAFDLKTLKSYVLLQVEYKDFPKNNKNEFVSLINCSSQPPLISHGIGKDVESCHDMVSLRSTSSVQASMLLHSRAPLSLQVASLVSSSWVAHYSNWTDSSPPQAALNILKLLAEFDQQSNERTGNGPVSG